jgi:UDP-3-O-[3-hydroxymyristoyl] glucosamine N-acyltransferase
VIVLEGAVPAGGPSEGTIWDGVIRLAVPTRLRELARRFGGELENGELDAPLLARIVPVEQAGEGDLAPLLSSRYARAAEDALARGASLLVEASLAESLPSEGAIWVHPHAGWALASLLGGCPRVDLAAVIGEGTTLGPNVVLGPRVVIGRNVTIGASAVIGSPGFGWTPGPKGTGEMVRVPQLGGVVIEDDVEIGALCTVDAGTLSPTRIRRGAKLDAQVHVGHNVEIGEGTIVAAQSGFAGSVRIGKGVLIGGQVGIADHITVGDGARIAAKSGVIGDVPAGAVVAGYPAVSRGKWLRGLARLYRLA